ncbi:nickel-dependent hydrogenase large subunit [Phosphitispora sp. TUW77]|uniref:nickel-dependent hydrogenase large subunit n=1 Tax=Phosphitispora sp. TUW77 TaxID=3152361 RepID=UPI003AB5FF6E
MAGVLVVHPLNRGIRPIRLELKTDLGKVTSAKAGTTYYWDLEKTLRRKDPMDAIQLTQRCSGVDFVSHAVAAVRALESIAGVSVPSNARLIRNILLALDIIYGNLAHFYQNAVPDYVQTQPSSEDSKKNKDFRMMPVIEDRISANVWKALEIRSQIHSIMGIVAGKAPHICNVVFSGITRNLNIADILKLKSILREVASFVNNEYAVDLGDVENVYYDYYSMGRGNGRLLTVSEFPGNRPGEHLIPGSVKMDSCNNKLDTGLITVDCTGSWFKPAGSDSNSFVGPFETSPNKPGGYSWVKGALYDYETYEVGASARMLLSGNSVICGMGMNTFSVMGRFRSRFEETMNLVTKIFAWIEQYEPDGLLTTEAEIPKEGSAIGAAEASQGSVIHFVSLSEGKIETYNALDSFSWNLCPQTSDKNCGPMEQSLVGLNVVNPESPIEVLRVARSF